MPFSFFFHSFCTHAVSRDAVHGLGGGQGTKPDALIMVALKIVTCMCDAPAGQQEGVAHDFFIATF